ncbi:MAG: UDP-N-acetylmuramoyl-L-alanyl-D-glutamate--2,6-diaminopimelate ligase [Polyangiaceae bacterium]|jgi:UDP-N-acetylmuramoyl-L-alanyl-D-glutamate--2,6-diaminopimelate ligase
MNDNSENEPSPGIRLVELASEVRGHAAIHGDGSVRIRGVRHDSRTVQPGDLFVARKGANVDGASFVADAVSRGAAAILAARETLDPRTVTVPVLFVDDVADGLAIASDVVYGRPSLALDVVGITGTNGKTTCAHLVRAALDGALGRAGCGTIGTLGHSFGSWRAPAVHTTPEADDLARSMSVMRALGATRVAMEVSSHALALGRVRALRFKVAALTNVTRDHLDFHRTMAEYAETKALLFTRLGPDAAVINVDDAFGRVLAARLRVPEVAECDRSPARRAAVFRVTARLGVDESNAEVFPRDVLMGARGIDATVRTPAGTVRIASRLIGAHNLDNLLLSIAIACALEVDVSRAAEALSNATAPPGRLERCDADGDDIVVVVDYAHTPDALARVLDAVRGVARQRVWCVFGCGGDRDPTKRALMGEEVARRAEVAVVTNDNPRTEDPRVIAEAVANGVRAAGLEPWVELDRRRAIAFAIHSATAGDVVLVAGKGHEDYQVVGAVKHPFDDRIEAREALAERRRSRGAG